jgi:hypothetical protein
MTGTATAPPDATVMAETAIAPLAEPIVPWTDDCWLSVYTCGGISSTRNVVLSF